MIQSAAPTVASVTAMLSGQPAENGAPGAENGAFAAVLARNDAPGAGSAAPPPAVDPTADPDTAANPADGSDRPALAIAQPTLAASLPLTGKILPGLLPDDAAAPAPDPSAKPAGTVPSLLAALRMLRLPQQDGEPGKAAARPAEPTTDAAPAEGEASADPAGLVAAGTQGPFASAATPLLTPDSPDSTQGAAPAALPAATPPALPPMIAAQLLGQPLRAAAPAETGPGGNTGTTEQTLSLPVDPARADAAIAAGAAAPLRFEAAPARPVSAVRLKPHLAEADGTSLTAAATADPASLLAAPFAGTAAAPAPAGAATSATLPSHPHDFAALMDRLIAARDAAQTGLPQTVQVALDHAEFGAVSLRFQHDQGGLAVSVASADPDFARAVQAAIPAPGPAGQTGSGANPGTGTGSGQGGHGQTFGRGDAAGNGGDSAQRQGRTARFDPDSPLPAASRGSGTSDSPPSRPRGIFA